MPNAVLFLLAVKLSVLMKRLSYLWLNIMKTSCCFQASRESAQEEDKMVVDETEESSAKAPVKVHWVL